MCRLFPSRAVRRGWALGVLALGAARVAGAEPPPHEFVPNAGSDADRVELAGAAPGSSGAFLYDGVLVEKPAGGALRPGEASVRGGAGASPQAYHPDRVTSFEGQANYYEVFTPGITPYKRMTALGAVTLAADGTPFLAVREGPSRPVPVEGTAAAAPDGRPRDRFWASVVLDFHDARRLPLPSVSPESRLLTLETDPVVNLRVEQDADDNFYAAVVGRAPGPVRVVYLMDAPVTYFGGAVPGAPLAPPVEPLPPSVRRDALAFAEELGLKPGMGARTVLDALVLHFRSFEEAPDEGGVRGGRTIYLDLARGMRGVCRHRAFAFVVTALALGLPARFAMNEAHAWVEVAPPGAGWVRVDLGGAATALAPHRSGDGPEYHARSADPFPRPEPYLRALEAARAHRASATGARDDARAAAPPVPREPATAPGDPAPETRGTAEVRLRLDHDRYEVYRGRVLEITGRALGPGDRGVPGLRIEVWIEGAARRFLGATVTDARGVFQTSVGVPADEAPGDYALLVKTPGNAQWGPAEAR